MFNASLLTNPDLQDFLKEAFSKKTDPLKIATFLSKEYAPEERKLILDYFLLFKKMEEKFGTTDFLLCDKLALEQSTAKDISRVKGTFFPENVHVYDLCCGMGGDSFFLPDSIKITGVDLDENRLSMYLYNMKVFKKNPAVLNMNVCEVHKKENTKNAYFMIDPARRKAETENQRRLENLTPDFEEILEIAKHYKGGIAKLPPAFPLEKIPRNSEIVYLGAHDDCRECLVLFGALMKNPHKIQAIQVHKNGTIDTSWISESDFSLIQNLSVKPLNNYIAEPSPLLIRSHLFSELVPENAGILSENIAYITSETPIALTGFRNFKVLDFCPLSTSKIKGMLRKRNIGKLTLKKRGVEINPEQEIKRLSPKGNLEAILFYTRIQGEKYAILTHEI